MTFTNDQWQEAVVYSANNPAGAGNPVITEEQIRAYILNGQGFTAYINGNVTAAQAAAVSLYFSNPSKNILIYRISTAAATAGSNCKLAKSSSDFALGAGGAVATNLNLNSGTTSIATVSSSITASSSGTIFDYTLLPSDIETEILANSEVVYIPAGTYNIAFAAFCDLVGSNGAGFVSISWLEI